MRVSAIDIGTNSIRQLICDIDGENIKKIRKDVEITRLGEGISKTEKLNNNAIRRSIEVIEQFVNLAREEGTEIIYAFATSAMRDAKNKEAFFEEIKKLGLDVEIIDGETESLYGYIGAVKGVNKKNAVVLDIGGGSTELAYKGEEFVKESFDIGAVRLTEKFIKNDPPSTEEYDEIRLHIIDMVINSLDKYKEVENIIGIGGTVTTLAAVSQQLEIYSQEKVHGYKLKKEEIKRILDKFMSVTLEERKLIPGLQPQRADIIITGTAILLTILEMLNLKEITVSEWDNLEGAVLYRFANLKT
ncbi:bifunctional 3-dehydroquinate synthase/phosphatase AroB [Thermoanaerobacter kivui]|uniref:Bifunctional 3-dehydroquinate synthase/phosphatase AroB n=1 Tax=Thermoanaerobacter kivui TaxID=2325 RepID=A0A097AU20_THEKI|nr:Ppx/GppA phosphatase family protein [Thermoanaerobacter kivui]AIS53314.1 bifunctional 3-dehydroquinate synthase/phosphatase AroB [Thermoanaerobacter kivui]